MSYVVKSLNNYSYYRYEINAKILLNTYDIMIMPISNPG